MSSEIKFKSEVWLYPGQAAWHFVSLPKNLSTRLKSFYAGLARGWGSLPVTVTIGTSSWQTSIFPDSKSGSFLLPLKASVRKKEGMQVGQKISVSLKVRL